MNVCQKAVENTGIGITLSLLVGTLVRWCRDIETSITRKQRSGESIRAYPVYLILAYLVLTLSNLADPIIKVLSCIQLIHVVLFFHVHMLEVTELTQALCLTLFFFRLLFFRSPPPKVVKEGIVQLRLSWTATLSQLEDLSKFCLDSLFRCYGWLLLHRGI